MTTESHMPLMRLVTAQAMLGSMVTALGVALKEAAVPINCEKVVDLGDKHHKELQSIMKELRNDN